MRSTSRNTVRALKLISSKFPIGVATTYKTPGIIDTVINSLIISALVLVNQLILFVPEFTAARSRGCLEYVLVELTATIEALRTPLSRATIILSYG
jgi:hypothetical protein